MSLVTCLHQITAIPGVQKTVLNAIWAVAFLLDEIEETQINQAVKDALDTQINEINSDIHLLLTDASNRINTHIKEATSAMTERLIPPIIANQQNPIPITYTLALINTPPHANPKLAAREGIKVRQFALSSLNTSSISHLTPSQIKDLLNNIITDLDLSAGKIRTITIACNTNTIIKADSNVAAKWLAYEENQKRICEKIDPSIKFSAWNYKVIAYNIPTDMDPKNP